MCTNILSSRSLTLTLVCDAQLCRFRLLLFLFCRALRVLKINQLHSSFRLPSAYSTPHAFKLNISSIRRHYSTIKAAENVFLPFSPRLRLHRFVSPTLC